MARVPRTIEYFSCPNCGAGVVVGKSFCRECGASDDAGWNDEGDTLGGYSDDDDFDYDQYVADEFPEHSDRGKSTPWTTYVAGVIIVLLVLAIVLGAVLY